MSAKRQTLVCLSCSSQVMPVSLRLSSLRKVVFSIQEDWAFWEIKTSIIRADLPHSRYLKKKTQKLQTNTSSLRFLIVILQSFHSAQITFQVDPLYSMSYCKWKQNNSVKFQGLWEKKMEKTLKHLCNWCHSSSSNCFICSLIFYLCDSVANLHHSLIKKVKAEGPVHHDS